MTHPKGQRSSQAGSASVFPGPVTAILFLSFFFWTHSTIIVWLRIQLEWEFPCVLWSHQTISFWKPMTKATSTTWTQGELGVYWECTSSVYLLCGKYHSTFKKRRQNGRFILNYDLPQWVHSLSVLSWGAASQKHRHTSHRHSLMSHFSLCGKRDSALVYCLVRGTACMKLNPQNPSKWVSEHSRRVVNGINHSAISVWEQ